MKADRVEELIDSLVWEGYALYPYTPAATKNATPTPFGTVYPPAYAAGVPRGPLDHLRCEVLLRGGGEPAAEVRCLRWRGEGHRADELRLDLPAPGARAWSGGPELDAVAWLEAEDAGPGLRRLVLGVENHTHVATGIDRATALRSSLLSTHVLVRAGAGGAFVSPLEAEGCTNVNTWPVLACDDDTVVVGAAMILPDHPELAPDSTGSLYDGTEIEEALLLHVMALSDAERAQIAEADPAVREMVARAAAATPDDLMRLHGVMRPGGPKG